MSESESESEKVVLFGGPFDGLTILTKGVKEPLKYVLRNLNAEDATPEEYLRCKDGKYRYYKLVDNTKRRRRL